jgi:hypothetical protein
MDSVPVVDPTLPAQLKRWIGASKLRAARVRLALHRSTSEEDGCVRRAGCALLHAFGEWQFARKEQATCKGPSVLIFSVPRTRMSRLCAKPSVDGLRCAKYAPRCDARRSMSSATHGVSQTRGTHEQRARLTIQTACGEETAGQFPRIYNRSGSNKPGRTFVVALIDIVLASIQILNL